MRNTRYAALLLVMLIFFLAGCGISDQEPTGYPSGEVQTSMVFARDTVYVIDTNDETLYYTEIPYGYEFYGTVEATDNTAVPDREFQAAHIETGTELYLSESDDSYLFIRLDDGTIKRCLQLQDSGWVQTYG